MQCQGIKNLVNNILADWLLGDLEITQKRYSDEEGDLRDGQGRPNAKHRDPILWEWFLQAVWQEIRDQRE